MNELRGVSICDITSPFNNKFHKEQTWACLDIIDETHEPSQWHLTSFFIGSQVQLSTSYHANEKNIRFNN